MAGTVVENDELELTLDDELDTMGPGDTENDETFEINPKE